MCEITITIKKMNTPKSLSVNHLVVSYPLQLVDYCLLGSSVHVILQARIQEWVAISYSRGPSRLRDPILISHISYIGRWVPYH